MTNATWKVGRVDEAKGATEWVGKRVGQCLDCDAIKHSVQDRREDAQEEQMARSDRADGRFI